MGKIKCNIKGAKFQNKLNQVLVQVGQHYYWENKH